jgi:type IV pilus assembly protein PilY1
MKNQLPNNHFLTLALVVCMILPISAYSATVDLTTVPLATATTTNVLPNLMFTLDDSGSMDSNYLPDWVDDSLCKSVSGSYNAACNQKSNLTTSPAYPNQPPYQSSDFNAIYYNPAIRYTPAINDAGAKVNTSGDVKGNQITPWTSVKNDAYNIQDTGSTNLVTGYTDVEWCTDNTYTDCLRNDNYILPNTSSFPVNGKVYATSHPSVKSTGSVSVVSGSPLLPTVASRTLGPHYYTIVPGEYCDSLKLSNCQTTATATFKYPVKVRWCSTSANATAAIPAVGSCQAIHKSGFTNARYPTKFFLPAVAATPGSPAVAATPGSPAVAATPGSPAVAATPGSPAVAATPGSPAVAATPGSPAVARVNPTGLITFGGGNTLNSGTPAINRTLSSNTNTIQVGTISASAANPLSVGKNKSPSAVASTVVSSIGTGGTIKAYIGGNAITPTCASKTNTVVCLVDTSTTVTNGKAVTVGTLTNFGTVTVATTASAGGVVAVAAVAPTPYIPAVAPTPYIPAVAPTPYIPAVAPTPYIPAVAPTPYIPAVAPTPYIPASYPGSFVRTDIVSGNSYPKVISRTDCTGAVGATGCSYAQEMTNFANWWTYYQTRMQAMKTAASLAFSPIDTRYRVGFNVISYTGATDGAYFLHIDTFNPAHRALWYDKLFKSNPVSYTPLRGAISKTGRIFAHKLTGAADPMQYSCQQNFTILSTDGYWNNNIETATYGPYDLNGAAVDNRDAGSSVSLPMREGATAVNTLADVTKYYYDTDLRDSSLSNCTGALGLDVCENNVFVSGSDNNVKQHMTTFTLGLGVNGTLLYTDDYKTATSGDFYDLKNGYGTPTVVWPDPISNTEEQRIDDLWHAAVNGQGTYFSAKDPAELTRSLVNALTQINAKVGAGAAAATSTLNPVAGNNSAYVASYTTVKWTGNLEARTIDLVTGAVSDAATWCVEDVVTTSCALPSTVVTPNSGANYYCVTPSAASCSSPGAWGTGTIPVTSCAVEVPKACTGKLRGQVGSGTRSIKMNKGGTLLDFSYTNLDATQQLNFQSTFLSTNLSQWSSLDPATQQTIAKEINLVNYLRGDKGFEDSDSNTAVNRLFRYREAVMGDALESAPVFVGKPNFDYLETSYAGFKTTSRTDTVYMGTNDGMLHAFNAASGTERWAYVPSVVIPNMWKLADRNYATMHTNYVNGTTTVSDVCSSTCANSTDWKTILVGGLNGGGKGYYALNVTGDTPALLWEFDTSKDNDMGYSFGNPVITKLKPDVYYPLGRWVVLLTSGYNNTTGDHPGKGFLYVLDATSGSVIRKIATGEGDSSTPSGLAKITSFVEYPSKNNETVYAYGGDLKGNLWRFDINADTSASNPFLLATLKDIGGTAQPITTRPELGKLSGYRVVFIGTGKYLENSDLTDTQRQTIYAIKDTGTFFNNARSYLTGQLLSTSGATRTATNSTANYFASGNGWYVDLAVAIAGEGSERQNVQGRLVSGTLVVPTTVPSNAVCSPGGYGWVNYFNYKNGGGNGTTGDGVVSSRTNAPPVGINIVYIDGNPVGSVTTADDATPKVVPIQFGSNPSGFSGKRAIWRELVE